MAIITIMCNTYFMNRTNIPSKINKNMDIGYVLYTFNVLIIYLRFKT